MRAHRLFRLLNMSDKILIALQFWKGDMPAALRLARYLADLEKGHSKQADLLLVHRFDCPFEGQDNLIQRLSRSFNVTVYRSPRRGVGWPDGCNELWFATMEWVHSMVYAGRVPHYKAIFTCEADGGPVFQDWISRMSLAWDAANKDRKVFIAGALTEPGPHINGNALISGDLKHLFFVVRKLGGAPPGIGWDYVYRDLFKRIGWADIPGMKSYYNSKNFTTHQFQQMIADELIWVHGDKSGCLIDYGRQRYLSPRI